MLENLYTTKMGTQKKQLQKRFSKIHSKNSMLSKIAASMVSVLVVLTLLCASITMAAAFNEEKNLFINGKGYAIDIVLIENKLATHTDNYYVPLRKTFEALGYEVLYDADKTKYRNLIDRGISFPVFDSIVYKAFLDENGETHTIEYNYEWKKEYVTSGVDYCIYGATLRLNRQMPIIEMRKNGRTEFCQIGSHKYSNGYALAPVLIDGTAYIPLRAVAYIVGGQENVKWNSEKKDTYFEGALQFNEAEKVISVSLT